MRRKDSAVVCIAELFAFVDLHASRWRLRRQAIFNDLSLVGTLPQYYDRQGFPIPADPDTAGDEPGWFMPVLQWAKLKEDLAYSTVARDDLPDGSYLSTVWLGLDHAHGIGPPLIFETMRFANAIETMTLPTGRELAYHPELEFPVPGEAPDETTHQLRYGSEEEALAAHHEIVRRIVLREGH